MSLRLSVFWFCVLTPAEYWVSKIESSAYVRSKTVALLLLIYCLLLLLLFVGFCVRPLFFYTALSVLSRFATILRRKREIVALL